MKKKSPSGKVGRLLSCSVLLGVNDGNLSFISIEELTANIRRRRLSESEKNCPGRLRNLQLGIHKAQCGNSTLAMPCPLDSAPALIERILMYPPYVNKVVEKICELLWYLLFVCAHARMTSNEKAQAQPPTVTPERKGNNEKP